MSGCFCFSFLAAKPRSGPGGGDKGPGGALNGRHFTWVDAAPLDATIAGTPNFAIQGLRIDMDAVARAQRDLLEDCEDSLSARHFGWTPRQVSSKGDPRQSARIGWSARSVWGFEWSPLPYLVDLPMTARLGWTPREPTVGEGAAQTGQKHFEDGSSWSDSDSDTDDDISTECPSAKLSPTSTKSSPKGQDSREGSEACIFGITGPDTRIQNSPMNWLDALQKISKVSSEGPQTCAHDIFNPQGCVTMAGA
jgi:hypothetical protein